MKEQDLKVREQVHTKVYWLDHKEKIKIESILKKRSKSSSGKIREIVLEWLEVQNHAN